MEINGCSINKEEVVKRIKKGFREIAKIEDKYTNDELFDMFCKKFTELDISDIVVLVKHLDQFCDKCGSCCRNCNPIIINQNEIDFFRKKFGNKFGEHIIYNKIKKAWYLRHVLPCEFLTSDNKCSIYAYKPEMCNLYPLNMIFDSKSNFIPFPKYCRIPVNIAITKVETDIITDNFVPEEMKKELEKITKNSAKEMDYKSKISGKKTILDKYLLTDELHKKALEKLKKGEK